MSRTNGTGIQVLTWDPVCQRSTSIAEELGRPLHTVHYLAYRRPAVAPIKYPLQFAKTLQLLRHISPSVTMVSNPPPFAALTAWLHHRAHGGSFVVDAHTGVFLEPKWKPFAPLNKFLMRRAALTLVTNEGLCETVKAWGGRPYILPDPLPRLGGPAPFPFASEGFNVSAVFSFYEDEPVDEFLAIRNLPSDMRIFVTGNSSRVPQQVRASLPEKITLTGFLSRQRYDALISQSQAAIVLCTRPHTMLCGAYEAAAAGKPLVTSESAAMRAAFNRGTVFVNNSTRDIEDGLRQVHARHAVLAAEMRDLAGEMRVDWRRRFDDCLEILAA